MATEATAWLLIITPSLFTGVLFAYFVKGRLGLVLSILIPWLGLLIVLLCERFYFPCTGVTVTMWPFAQLFGGTIAAIAGLVGYQLTMDLFCRKKT